MKLVTNQLLVFLFNSSFMNAINEIDILISTVLFEAFALVIALLLVPVHFVLIRNISKYWGLLTT